LTRPAPASIVGLMEPALVLETDYGPVSIYDNCPPGVYSDLELDPGIGHFHHYSSIIQKLEVFDRVASGKDGRVTLALRDDRFVVGYLTCWYPDKGERWSKLGDLMYELATIETSRNYRKIRLGSRMVGIILSDPLFEHKITYMNGFSWHWDLDGNGLTMAQYRQLMMRLLAPYGFKEQYTNEPNIALREENLFMVRIGSLVSEEDIKRFRSLRFGIVSG
jgi:hypothetical protein